MSTNQEETKTTQEVVTNEVTTQTQETNIMKAGLGNFFSNWKVRTALIIGLVVSVIVGLFLIVFFWQHTIAELGMKNWSARSGATPIECMIKDTNDDQYVSCSAILNDQVVPLECGSSVFNIGCRVNYGSAVQGAKRGVSLPVR